MNPLEDHRYLEVFGQMLEEVEAIIEISQRPEDDVDPMDAIMVAALMHDVTIRDAVLCYAAIAVGDGEDKLLSLMERIVYAAIEGAAPMATAAAILHWMKNDRERSEICLGIALLSDEDYRLARMFQMMMSVDTPGDQVRKMMSEDILS